MEGPNNAGELTVWVVEGSTKLWAGFEPKLVLVTTVFRVLASIILIGPLVLAGMCSYKCASRDLVLGKKTCDSESTTLQIGHSKIVRGL